MSARLKDRVCVVTGAARGIGLAIAERFGRGGRTARLRRRQRAALEPAVAELEAKGFDARGYAVDVGRREAVHAMFARIEARFRRARRRARQQRRLGPVSAARRDRRRDGRRACSRSASRA